MKELKNKPFGLTIKNFQVKQSYSTKEKESLANLLYENRVLVIKNLSLNSSEFEEIAKFFGKMEIAHPTQYQEPNHPCIRHQSNIGNGIGYGGNYWHSDGPWSNTTSKVTLLSCIQAPKVGGETLFIDMCNAYNDLPSELKYDLENLDGFYPCRQIYLDDMAKMGLVVDDEKKKNLQNLTHSLVRVHPITGEKALYLNEMWLKEIKNVSKEKSLELLSFLYSFCTDKNRIYQHKWEKDDLLVWDNNAVMHKGIRPESEYPKVTRRITIQGDS